VKPFQIEMHKVKPMQKQIKIVVERHDDGYVAYPLGLRGVVVGEGDSYEAALADVTSAIQFHIETFGPAVLREEPAVLEAYITETAVPV
jgi:predicted RNase H-like HicB family nuclease